MPKKRNVVKDNWEEIKSYLPKNWCQHISDNLNKRGIAISPQSVSDARTGRIKNVLIRQQVWKEIKKVSKANQKALESIEDFTI